MVGYTSFTAFAGVASACRPLYRRLPALCRPLLPPYRLVPALHWLISFILLFWYLNPRYSYRFLRFMS
jgi:hypothetical protein